MSIRKERAGDVVFTPPREQPKSGHKWGLSCRDQNPGQHASSTPCSSAQSQLAVMTVQQDRQQGRVSLGRPGARPRLTPDYTSIWMPPAQTHLADLARHQGDVQRSKVTCRASAFQHLWEVSQRDYWICDLPSESPRAGWALSHWESGWVLSLSLVWSATSGGRAILSLAHVGGGACSRATARPALSEPQLQMT